ncbi:hypothetical protein [Phenylobacterium sp. J367]|uniref:hypothetical protein n=1 Tax=Phenylobacterium sp. J367 TaxID=2898435 RepID=UPI002150A9EF|nr:hypothetical protein [Phenylobacterium sp. J367]MCR5879536.1 hypothetical protein [Phenylobacterium sp. J367]
MTMFQTLRRMMSPQDTLRIRCGACGREAAWLCGEAIARLGPDATPMDVRRRLRCGACGAAGQARISI